MRVISKDEAIILWDKLNSEFKFKPGTDITGEYGLRIVTIGVLECGRMIRWPKKSL